MEVILKEDVLKLGFRNDIVTVKNGFGLNYLIPQGIATLATPSNKKILAENLKQRAHKESKIKDEAEKIAAKIAGVNLKVGAKAGDGGKIFGSVNNIQIADALKALGIDVDRKVISLTEVKTLGEYVAKARLHKEVEAEIKFEVIEE